MHRIASESVDESKPAQANPERNAIEWAFVAPALPQAGLIATQQMGNVGLLATGLAHDLNNLLTVILGSAELAREMLPGQSPVRHHLHTIETTVRRAGELCHAMLACARADQCQVESIDANAVVRDTVTLLQSSQLAFHRLRLDLAPDLPALRANPAQFRQVALNLLANAAEACGPRGGRIRVSTTPTQIDARSARQMLPAGVPAGRFLRLRVTDDGCGMDEATRQRLFTPFFTHKGPGRGLGLASLLEIARIHGGGVRVFSEAGRGSIFDVFLPLGAAAPTEASVARPAAPIKPEWTGDRLSGTILLADDEEILRDSLGAFLTGQGLTVVAVDNGEAACARLAAPSQIDLILMDLMMPKLSGLDALKAMRADGQRVPVILMTGLADVAIADLLGGLEPAVVLAKPFSLVELLRVIGELLPRQASAG